MDAGGRASSRAPAGISGSRTDVSEREHERAFCAEDDETLSPMQIMVAGAAAGMTEHIVMFPVDTVKTRMQSYVGVRDYAATSVLRAAQRISASEGHAALWRGVGAVALSAGPAHALYFAAYEAVRARLETRAESGKGVILGPFAPAIAGGVATVVLDGVMTPLDVVKQRMQLATNRGYTSVLKCIQSVYAMDGISAFFAGYKATLVMNIPFMAVYFSAYESAKKVLIGRRDWNRRKSSRQVPIALPVVLRGEWQLPPRIHWMW